MKQYIYSLDSDYCIAHEWEQFLGDLDFAPDQFEDLKSFMQSQSTNTKNRFFRWLLSKDIKHSELEVKCAAEESHRLVLKRQSGQIFAILYISDEESTEGKHSKQARFWNSFKSGFSEGVIFVDKNKIIEEASERTPQMFPLLDSNGVQLNRHAMLGRNIHDLFPASWMKHFEDFFTDCKLNHLASLNKTFEFEEKHIECKAYPIYEKVELEGFMILFFDITEKIKLEIKLAETKEIVSGKSHLIALGELAGKIAHEINTPLGAITLNASVGEKKCGSLSHEKNTELFKKIKETGFFIGEIVKNLLQFSRHEVGTGFEKCNIKEVVDDVISIARVGMMNSGIVLETQIDESCAAEIKRVQIQQVFLNLFSNSVAALKAIDKNSGWIRILAKDLENHIQIQFIDSGEGIREDIAEKILTPNYSTKELGKNLGIGLSVCCGIVHAHGGTFELDSEHPNTCFVILMPKKQSENLAA